MTVLRNQRGGRRNLSQMIARGPVAPRLASIGQQWRSLRRRDLMLTTLLGVMVWSGYNSGINYVSDSKFPTSFIGFVHGIRAFFPILAAVIAACRIATKGSLSKWMAFSPLSLMLLYGTIGLASSIFVSNNVPWSVYWALQFISVIIVVMSADCEAEPELHLDRFIAVNWAFIALICLSLLAGFSVFGGDAIHTRGSLIGVEAYGQVQDVMGMPGSRNTGFGRFAGIVIVVALAKVLHDRKKKATLYFWMPLMTAGAVALVFSQARTSWVSVLVALAALLARAPTRWRVPIIMIALLAMPVVFLTGFGHAFFLYLTRDRAVDLSLTGRTATWADAWHLWTVMVPRRSITGRLLWGKVWRRHDGRRWMYKKFVEYEPDDLV